VLWQHRTGSVRAVDGISFDLHRGRTLGLVGESGSGKSTTGRALVQLSAPSAGSIKFEGRELLGDAGEATADLRRRVQMIFQDPYSSLNPRMTVGAIIGEPLAIHRIGNAEERRARVKELLEIVGLPLRSAERFPHQFSGGQRQRIGIARALALRPDLVIADEPISALDVSIQAQILNLLRRLTKDLGLATIFIAHQLAVVRYVCDEVAVMYLGRIVERGPIDAVFSKPQHPYTVALLSAHPEPGAPPARRAAIKGDIPSPLNIPSGCRFRTRCPYAEERCLEPPPEFDFGGAHRAECVVLPFRRDTTS
jgi:oligopeptide transport system ATP-binding protein